MFNFLTEAAKFDFKFMPEKFVDSLKHMGIGMLVIFVIIGVIVLATKLVNNLSSDK